MKALPHKNLAVELLRKLLHDEIRARKKTNLIQSEKFSEKLEKSVRHYRNRFIQTADLIKEPHRRSVAWIR